MSLNVEHLLPDYLADVRSLAPRIQEAFDAAQ